MGYILGSCGGVNSPLPLPIYGAILCTKKEKGGAVRKMFFNTCELSVGKCEEGWKMNDNYCYLNVYFRLTWFGAFAHCLAKQSEMYVETVHGHSISATMTQKFWIGLAQRRPPNPILGWEWTSGMPLQWDKAEIMLYNRECSGCGYLRNRTLYLTWCRRNLLYLCDGDSSGIHFRAGNFRVFAC